jgi:hypothetical protein
MEKDVKVICRKQDEDKVKKAAEEAAKEFAEEAGFKDVKTEVVTDLPDASYVSYKLETLISLMRQQRRHCIERLSQSYHGRQHSRRAIGHPRADCGSISFQK